MSIWGRGLAVAIGLALTTSQVAAQPEDEIEMEGDPPAKPDPAKDPKPPADKPVDKPAEPPAPTDPSQPAATKDPKLAKKVAITAQQAAAKGDGLVKQKKLDEAKVSYEAAVAAYTKAIELGDDLNLAYELAIVEDKLGKFAVAATRLRTLAKATTGVRPDVLKKAATKLTELATKIGTVTLAVKPEGATITLGETEVGKSPLAEPLFLMPGAYSFQLQADGFQSKTVELTVEAGSESERGIDLEPIKISIDTRPPIDPVPPPPKPQPPSKLPLLIGAGATGGFLIATIVTGLMAKGKHDTFVDPETAPFDRELAAYDGKNFAKVSDVMLIGTVAAAGFTATWYFFKYRKGQAKLHEMPRSSGSPDEPQRSKVMMLPWVSGDGTGGLTLRGGF